MEDLHELLLSPGTLAEMMIGAALDQPVIVQVLGILKIGGIVEGYERYRLLISDGLHVLSHVLLTMKMNDMGTTSPPERLSVINVTEYFTTRVPRPGGSRLLLVLTDIQVLLPADVIQWPIGNPTALFNSDVVIVVGDSSLQSVPEPVFESVSPVHTDTAGMLSAEPAQLLTAAVQALSVTKSQPVRALSPVSLPSTSKSSASSQSIVPTASSVRTTARLSRMAGHVQQPVPLVKPPPTQVTEPAVQVPQTAVPTTVMKPPPVQWPTSVTKLLPVQGPTSIIKPARLQRPAPVTMPNTSRKRPFSALEMSIENLHSTPAFQVPQTATPTTVTTPPPVQRPTSVTQPAPVQRPTPIVKPARLQTPTPVVKLAPVQSPTPAVKPPLVQTSTPAVKPLPVQTPTPIVKPPPVQTSTPIVKPPPVQTSTPIVKPPPVQRPIPETKLPPAQTLTPVAMPNTSRKRPFSALEIMSIANLHPTVKKWAIKARVTAKSPIKAWASGSGCSFTIDLADESGEIKATVFTEWVNKYFGVFKKDQVYYISMGNLKKSNRRFNHVNHDYEMILNGATSVVPCEERVAVVQIKCKFVPLSEVTCRPHGTVIDVIGVCTSAAEVESVMTRSGAMPKREVTLVDQSATPVILKLWNEHAGTVEPTNRPIIAVRGVMIKEYWGVINLTTLVSSVVRINPDIPEAQQLRTWYASSMEQ